MIRKVNKSTLDATRAIARELHHSLYKMDECHSDEDNFSDECEHDVLLRKLVGLVDELNNQAERNAATKTSVYALKR